VLSKKVRMQLGAQPKILLLATLALAPAAAAAQPKDNPAPAEAPSAEMQKLLQNCEAHRFETVIETTVDGQPKKSKVRLCGNEGQSDADWIRTLKDAVEKTAANDKMSQAMRDQLISALNGEITRLTGLLAKPPAAVASTALPPPRAAPAPQSTIGRDYASLPPLPATPPPPTRVIAAGAANIPLLARPRLSITCFSPGDVGADGPCTDFVRDTLVTVRAGEDLPAGTSLRFVRNGDRRADVELAGLKRGKSLRFALPQDVCRGVGGGRLEVRIVRSAPGVGELGQEVGREGPFNLRC
jgi:hypothetical protein